MIISARQLTNLATCGRAPGNAVRAPYPGREERPSRLDALLKLAGEYLCLAQPVCVCRLARRRAAELPSFRRSLRSVRRPARLSVRPSSSFWTMFTTSPSTARITSGFGAAGGDA